MRSDAGVVHIRVLYLAGCPHSDETFDLVRRIARSPRRGTIVERIEVTTGEDAVRLRFLGSPTVQLNGVDIDPAARGRTDFALTCRLYGTSGVPASDMITAAIRDATE